MRSRCRTCVALAALWALATGAGPARSDEPRKQAPSGAAVTPQQGRHAVERGLDGWGWLVLPGVLFLGLVFFVPVLGMVSRSVTDPSPANYAKISSDPLVWRSLVYTLRIAVTVTVICLVIGYAWAYIMNRAHPTLQIVMAALIMVPFWSSLSRSVGVSMCHRHRSCRGFAVYATATAPSWCWMRFTASASTAWCRRSSRRSARR